MKNKKKKKIVVVGGGTGTFTVLRGLKEYSDKVDVCAIVTMADDGGSNRVLRDEFGMLPTSGIRQAIVAMSEDEGLMRELFTYRYYQGVGISGMTFGNLFMAALSDILKSQRKGIEETCSLMKVVGRILPVTYETSTLLATYDDGTEVLGEHMIDEVDGKVGRVRIKELRLIPRVKIDKEAKSAIIDADLIVLGPGDLYTNTIANLVVEGLVDSINKSEADIVFVTNLMTKLGEAYGYKASDFVDDLGKYMSISRLSYIIANSNYKFSKELLKAYEKEDSYPTLNNLGRKYNGVKVVSSDFVSKEKYKSQKGDKMKRSMIRHDSQILAKEIIKLLR